MEIREIKEKILNGYLINKIEALEIFELESDVLMDLAQQIRQAFISNSISLCSILNAKSGSCSEDCRYCSQSKYYNTGITEYPMIDFEKAYKAAAENYKYGVKRFSLVTSGRTLMGKDFEDVLSIYRRLKKEFPEMQFCASHGLIDLKQAKALKAAGVSRYHNNLETGKNYFTEICSTHTYAEKIKTIKNVKEAGLEVCCGGILGMGETIEDRIDMILDIREIGVDGIPLNVLNPVKGTPLGGLEAITPIEVLKTLALFRLMIPNSDLRYAGGRSLLGEVQEQGLADSVTGMMVGNYLTTLGTSVEDDLKLIDKMGLILK